MSANDKNDAERAAKEAAERRTAGRLQCDDLSCGEASVLDMSATGMRLRCRPKTDGFEVGATRLVTISGSEEPITIAGKVVWVRAVHRAVEVGIEFLEPTADVRRQLFLAASGIRSLTCTFSEAA